MKLQCYTNEIKSIINAALVSRTGIFGSSGLGGVLSPMAVVKSMKKSVRIVSNSCAFSRGSFVAAALRRSCISFSNAFHRSVVSRVLG